MSKFWIAKTEIIKIFFKKIKSEEKNSKPTKIGSAKIIKKLRNSEKKATKSAEKKSKASKSSSAKIIEKKLNSENKATKSAEKNSKASKNNSAQIIKKKLNSEKKATKSAEKKSKASKSSSAKIIKKKLNSEKKATKSIEKKENKKEKVANKLERKLLKIEKQKIKENTPTKLDRLLKKSSNKYNKTRSGFGYTKFEVEGLNLSKLLSVLSKDFILKKVSFQDRKISFFSYSADSKKIIALIDNLCYNYKIINTYGSLPFAMSFFSRVGIVLGVVASIVLLCVYPNFVSNVTVEGVDHSQISDILKKYGVYEGNYIPNFDNEHLANELLKLDGISFCSVKKVGTHIFVNLVPEHTYDNSVQIKNMPVLATKISIVSRVIVYSGTSIVKYGDAVQVGDTLIDNCIIVGEARVDSPAVGEVYGKVFHQETYFFPHIQILKIEGDTKTYQRLGFFGKTPKPPKAPFENYRLHKSVTSNGFLIPFDVYTYSFTEIKKSEAPNTLSNQQMMDLAFGWLYNSLPPHVAVLDRYFQLDNVSNGVNVKVVIETEERID